VRAEEIRLGKSPVLIRFFALKSIEYERKEDKRDKKK
jgi:hypothetical protein